MNLENHKKTFIWLSYILFIYSRSNKL